ncbi:hypothetical protein ACLKMH_15320 [Psychromonas sp. KJ10-10]|uniref:hypothetical protein n=1 Tax=Psychromonas sp. KJ10-10 TaxID=3391823 RepID=UPI0039B6D99D
MEFLILLFVLICILLIVKRLMIKKTAKVHAYMMLIENSKKDGKDISKTKVINSLNSQVEDLFKNDFETFKKLGIEYFDTLKDPNEAKKLVVLARSYGWNG